MSRFENTSTSANSYSQTNWKAGDRLGYIWLMANGSSNYGGDGWMNFYAATGGVQLWSAATVALSIDTSQTSRFYGNVGINRDHDGYALAVTGSEYHSGNHIYLYSTYVNVNGTLAVTGTLNATGSKTFKIPHPLSSKKDTHDLVHASVESPKVDLIYRGVVQLESGSATINIDTHSGMTEGTFVALCDDIQCSTTNESDWGAVKGSVSGNVLTIECEDSSSTANVAWMVIGERKDEKIIESSQTDEYGKLIVEPEQIEVPEI